MLPDEMAASDWRTAYTFPDETRNNMLQLAVRGRLRLENNATLSGQVYAHHQRQ
ncbi:hypothetical protein LP420_14550 [Massilia sp. B-10]|nr:hypothetical protein LP420_14550 [Massilia sp. B-10]